MRAQLSRREFLWVSAAGVAGMACGGDPVEISDAERALLDERTRAELAASGTGPLGELRFRGYRGLAELPWFELDGDGQVRLTADLPAGVDLHTHLAIAVGLAPAPDLHARTERVVYLLDCDAEHPGCELDLDVYMNLNFTPSMRRRLWIGALRQATIGTPEGHTHTLPNLSDELDRAGFEKAAVLPLEFGLPFRGDLTGRWLDAIEESPHRERFIPGCTVDPRDPLAKEKLREHARRGARIVKLHPEMQRFRPDSPEALDLYPECLRLGLPILFHAGRSGIEPESIRPYALLRHFEAAAESAPELPMILGHGGARDLPDALPLVKRHPNLYLGLASLGASAIRRAVDECGADRIVFGSDWPFYPLVTSLAKLLLATRDVEEAREPILRGNATRVFREMEGRRGAA